MPSVAPTRPSPAKRRPIPGGKSVRVWWWTVITGGALLVLLVVHMVAHHFVVDAVGGLRSYRQVLEYIATPVIFVIECFFLLTVTTHALLGLRAVLYDMGFGARARWRIDAALWLLGVATVAYGFFLVGALASRA